MGLHLKWVILGVALTVSACGSGGGSTKPSQIPSSSFAHSSSNSSSSAASISTFIVVDQFGYLPEAKKIAVIRDPQTGYDADLSFTPGNNYQLINLDNNEVVLSGTTTAWNAGATYALAGDKAWWFDFSSVTTPGTYAVVDVQRNVRSPGFKIASDIYKPVLKQAMRTFFYQRAGFAKQLPYAEAAWVDAASHIGPGQDKNARPYSDKNNAATEKDLSGGWYDAGDYNKYTNWHADYLITLLHVYSEHPSAWTDDYNIPESGNGIPDLIDEIRWGFDWLKKMQNENGSVLSIVGLSHSNAMNQHASPPSAATGPSFYGPASTSATLTSAGAFALGSKVLATLNNEELTAYAADLKNRAENAWTWALANPNVTFYNNDQNTPGLGAGQQEVDDEGRALKKLRAAIYLFAATDKLSYRNIVDAASIPDWVGPWNEPDWMSWLYYANLSNATPSVAASVKSTYASSMNASESWPAVRNNSDPYRAYLGNGNFTWGSNRTMMRKGANFYNLVNYAVGNPDLAEVRNVALGYINYIHGVNPLAMVYLSNMYSLGVQSSVNEFYHSWFADGSALWDRVGTSTYGPAPGFLVGGPNPHYNWDTNCTSNNPHPDCGSGAPAPPRGQPAMKSYLDFNTSWPINSWEVTENHNDYQVAYVRLLSKFVSN